MPTIQSPPARPVVYPVLETRICIGSDAITADQAKQVLGWETESEYLERMASSSISKHELRHQHRYYFTLRDAVKLSAREKVRCWNAPDQPADPRHYLYLVRAILTGQVIRAKTMPDVALSLTGQVKKGQYLLMALVLAHQMWKSNRDKYPLWKDSTTGPVVEAGITIGVSEEEEYAYESYVSLEHRRGELLRKLKKLRAIKPDKLANKMFKVLNSVTTCYADRQQAIKLLIRKHEAMWRKECGHEEEST